MQAVEAVQLEIGDEDETLFTVEQVEHKLNERGGNVLQAAADLCDIMATRTARAFDFNSATRQQFRRSQQTVAWERRAKALRERVGGLVTVPTTRVDGYSEDISNRDGAAQNTRTGRVRVGYNNPDLPY